MDGAVADSEYDGMTTNERLFEAGLLDTFDQAAKRRDRAAVIADTILANPHVYGF